ncbi:hypothetical protein B0H11DRAFT_2321889 [Mycena galericulata]|nr:hypothetical protein B0H11DRAFT_2321889 [Mycena galericulata]
MASPRLEHVLRGLRLPYRALPADGPTDGPATGIKTWLTALLSLACPPTRSAFLTSALSLSALALAPPTVTRLYQTLEVTFDPLSLCAEIAPVLRELKAEEDYALYVPLLKHAVLSRLLRQLAHVYASVPTAAAAPIAAGEEKPETETVTDAPEPAKPKHKNFFDPEQVESYIMGCVRCGELAVDVLEDASLSSSSSSAFPATSASASALGIAELVRMRPGSVACGLHCALAVLEPTLSSSQAQEEKLKARVAMLNTERKALQLRRALVARRRELLSELSVRKE